MTAAPMQTVIDSCSSYWTCVSSRQSGTTTLVPSAFVTGSVEKQNSEFKNRIHIKKKRNLHVDKLMTPVGLRFRGFQTLVISGGFGWGAGGGRAPIHLTNFCINVKSNPRMHQNPPFSGKNSFCFWGGGTAPSPDPSPRPSAPHYKILDQPLLVINDLGILPTQTLLLSVNNSCVCVWACSK